MPISQLAAVPPADATVLLVLLPAATGPGQLPASVQPLLDYLRERLSPPVRVLKISAATHPEVVQSFRAHQLPAFVLVHQGVEIWRQQGLAGGEEAIARLLDKVKGYAPSWLEVQE